MSELTIYGVLLTVLQFNINAQGDCRVRLTCQQICRPTPQSCNDVCQKECTEGVLEIIRVCSACDVNRNHFCRRCETYTFVNSSQVTSELSVTTGSEDEQTSRPTFYSVSGNISFFTTSDAKERSSSYLTSKTEYMDFHELVTVNVGNESDSNPGKQGTSVTVTASVISLVIIAGFMCGFVCWIFYKKKRRKQSNSSSNSLNNMTYDMTTIQTTDKNNVLPTVESNCTSEMTRESGYTSLHLSSKNNMNEQRYATSIKPDLTLSQQDDQQYTYLKQEMVEHQQENNKEYTYINVVKHCENETHDNKVSQACQNEYMDLQKEIFEVDKDAYSLPIQQERSAINSEYTYLHNIKNAPTKVDNEQDSVHTTNQKHDENKQGKVLETQGSYQPTLYQNLGYQSPQVEVGSELDNFENAVSQRNDKLNHLTSTSTDSNSEYATLAASQKSSGDDEDDKDVIVVNYDDDDDNDDYKYSYVNPQNIETKPIPRDVPQAYFNQPINHNCDYMYLQKADYAELNDQDREPNKNQYDKLNRLARESDDVNNDYNKLITGPVYDEESEEYSHINRSLNTNDALSDPSYEKLQLQHNE